MAVFYNSNQQNQVIFQQSNNSELKSIIDFLKSLERKINQLVPDQEERAMFIPDVKLFKAQVTPSEIKSDMKEDTIDKLRKARQK